MNEENPPSYFNVLLQQNVRLFQRHRNIFPKTLMDLTLEAANLPSGSLSNHPHRTYHRVETSDGLYYGELDYKSRESGFGRKDFHNGDIYLGNWSKGRRQGIGLYMWADTGSLYYGHWASGERRGAGWFVFGPARTKSSDSVVALEAKWRGKSFSDPTTTLLLSTDKKEIVPVRIKRL